MKILEKKLSLVKLGESLRHELDDVKGMGADFTPNTIIPPQSKEEIFSVTLDYSYAVVLHFPDQIRIRLEHNDKLTDDIVDMAIQEITLIKLRDKMKNQGLSENALKNRLNPTLKSTHSIIQHDNNKLQIFNYDQGQTGLSKEAKKQLNVTISTQSMKPVRRKIGGYANLLNANSEAGSTIGSVNKNRNQKLRNSMVNANSL